MVINFTGNRIFILSLALISFIIGIAVIGGDRTTFLWKEGRPVEILSDLSYFAAFLILTVAAFRARGARRFWFGLWAALCFIFFGEESSWLQHYLAYDTPDILAPHNAQGELNLHNLNILQGRNLGEGGSNIQFKMLSSQTLFQLGFLTYFLILPLAARMRGVRNLIEKMSIPVVGVRFVAAFWLPIVASVALTIITLSDPVTKSAMAEIREMFYAVSILGFAVLCGRAQFQKGA